MKKFNTNTQNEKAQNPHVQTKYSQNKLTVVFLIALIAIIAVSFTMTRFKGKSEHETQETIESLISENEENPLSEAYLVTDDNISRVYPNTDVETFVTNFAEGEVVTVYKDKACTEPVTDGFVASGMFAKYEQNNRVYEISVLGDINEKATKTESGAVLQGDGVLNQIELTRDIRSCVDENWAIDDEVEKKSGDVNCANQIDELSVKTIIDYLVFGSLNIPEVADVEKPSIDVMSGNMNTHTVYTSNVTLKITENAEDALKTAYKITGSKTQEYTEAVNGEEIVLDENGTYKITVYTYGKLKNKSKIEYIVITIDKNADYKMEYYLEGENGEFTKVDEDTKTVEGIIGETVEIEGKQYTDYELDVDNSNGKLQGVVLDDDSLVLKAYYTRKQFTYSFIAGDYVTSITAAKAGDSNSTAQASTSITAKWGSKININATIVQQPGYQINWTNWENIDDENDKITNQQTQLTVGKANKTYKANATKTKNNYTINCDLNGGSLPTNVSNNRSYTVETETFTLTNPTRPGYEFKGWTGGVVNNNQEIDNQAETGNTPNTQTPTTQLQINSGSLGNRKYTANWEAITNTPYKIQYYKETLKTGEFALAEEENKGGTTDTTVTVSGTSKTYEGFEFDETNDNNLLSGTVTANKELVLKLYYTRKTYDLTIIAGDNVLTASAEGEALEQGSEGETNVGKYTTSSTKTLKYKYGQKVDLSAVLENDEGYEYQPIHWTSSNTSLISNIAETEKQIAMVAGNVTLTAVAEKSAITYTITYNTDDINFPENTTILTKYTVENQDIAIPNLQDGSKTGYSFTGWTGSNGNVPSLNVVIPAGSTGNKTYTANWTEADFGYTIEYYYEQANGYVKDESKTETGTAKFNSQVSEYTNKAITGYELKETTGTLKIKADETQNIMKVYYVKKRHNLTLQKDSNIVSVEGSGEYKYGDTVNIKAYLNTADGYTITFNKWESQTTGVADILTQEGSITIPDSDVTLKATTNKVAIPYTVTCLLNGGTLSTETEFEYNIESNDITLPKPTRQGYGFAGWTGGTEKTNYGTTGNTETPDPDLIIRNGSMGNRIYEANWVGDTKTPYKVEHYKENLDGTYPTTPTDTVNKEGTTDAQVIAAQKEYAGFEYDSSNESNVLQGNVKPDGTLVLKVYYKRCYYTVGLVADSNITNVSYSVKDGVGAKTGTPNEANGTELQGEFKYGTQINISAEVKQETGYTIEWNKWQSNDSQKIVDQATRTALIGVPAGDVTLTAKATKTANSYKYHVQYYYDNVLDNSKTVENEVSYGTIINSYPNKNITGFIFDKDENKPLTVTENEDNNTIKVYYKHVDYNISYDLDGGDMPIVDGQEQLNPTTYSVLSETFTLIEPVKPGYTFLGWTGSNGETPQTEITITQGSTEAKNYKANWRANTDTRYVIEHYEEGLDGSFEVVDTEELYGTTGDTVTVEDYIKELTGYTFDEEDSIISGKIKGDGTTSFRIRYKRNEFTLTLKAGDNIDSVGYSVTNEHAVAEGYNLIGNGTDISVKLKYGAGLTISGTLSTEEHYSITNGTWSSNNASVNPNTLVAEIVMPAADVTLTASATKTGLPYKYYTEYYYENELDRTNEATANYKTTISNYTGINKTGYKFDHVTGLPLEITENEETNVIKVYYVLQNYTITCNLEGGSLEQGQTNPENYNITTETFTLNKPKKQGYVFTGWTGSNGNEAQEEVTISKGTIGDKEYTANWRPSNQTEYKVEHYIENLDSTEDGTSAEVNENNYTLYAPQELQTTFTGTTNQSATATPTEITGFTYSETKSAGTKTATILPDGTTVLKLYYTRNTYKLKLTISDDGNISLLSNGGTLSETQIEKSYKYEQQVEIGAATSTITGHIVTFASWISSDENLVANNNNQFTTITIPAGDVTLTATGNRAKGKYTYKVYYYYENADGEMIEDESLRFTSEAIEFDTEILSYPDEVKTGYELDRAETVPFRISANLDDNQVNVYYKLKNYEIHYDLGEGVLQNNDTNPETYNMLSSDITLKNPEKDGYVFVGWTGGVINDDGELDNTIPTGTSANVTEPTKSLKIKTGSLGNRKYTANWVERTYVVTVKHYLEGTGPAYNNEAVEVASEEVYTTLNLGDPYEVEDLILDYNEQGVVQNGDIDKRNYLDDSEFKAAGNSGNTTGNYTLQDIEVIFYYKYKPVVKIISSPEQGLVNKEYITIKDALQAIKSAGLTKSSGLTKMQILRNVKDESVIIDNLNVQIDLNSYTINSNAELTDNSAELETLGLENATLMLKNSKLTLVDLEENGTGKLVSKNCSGVYVDANSEFTLGIEERPVYEYPTIEAKTYGVKKQTVNSEEGVFNFFDGKIVAEVKTVEGTTDLTPLLYERTNVTDEQGRKITTLKMVSGKEARIGRTTYNTLENAIEAVPEGEEQTEIVLLTNLSKSSKVVFPIDKNIKLDLAGYTFTTTATDYVLENKGKLEIVDSSANEDNIYGSGKIISTTGSAILNYSGTGKELKEYTYQDIETTQLNGFINEGNSIVSNNYAAGNTTARGYFEIDLTEYDETQEYILSVNAQISSEKNYDFGYAIISDNTDNKEYNNEQGKFIYISGTESAKNYNTTLKGGKKYYLHIGYRKDGSTNGGSDRFTVNKIKLYNKIYADLSLTNGNYCVNKSGSSGYEKNVIENNGTLTISKTDSNFSTKIYSDSNYSYITAITGTGKTLINKGRINMAGSYTIGIRAKGELTIKNTYIYSYLGTIYIDSPTGTEINIDNVECKNVYINTSTINTIKNSTLTGLTTYKNSDTTIENTNLSSIEAKDSATMLIKSAIVKNSCTFNGVTTIKNGTFNDDILAYNTLTIENGNFYNAVDVRGTTDILGGYFEILSNSSSDIFENRGTLNIRGGTFKNTINNKSTVNVYETVDISGTSTVIDNCTENSTINMYGGKISSNASVFRNSNTNCTINIYGGNLSTTSNSYPCIYDSNSGNVINIGIKNDETIGANNPVISAPSGYAIKSLWSNINFYDGTIKGAIEKVIIGKVNEIPDGLDILVSYEGENNGIEVNTLGVSNRVVAQIGNTPYYKLQDAIDACTNGVQTTVKVVDKIYLSKTVTVGTNKNVILDLNGYSIKSYTSSFGLENNGTLSIVDNSGNEQSGKIYSIGGTVLKNNSVLSTENVLLEKHSYNNRIIDNAGNLTVNGTIINMDEANHATGIFNDENADLAVNNLTISFNGASRESIQYMKGIYNKSTKDITIENSVIRATGIAINNEGTGKLTLKDCIASILKCNYGTEETISNMAGTLEIDGGSYTGAQDNKMIILNKSGIVNIIKGDFYNSSKGIVQSENGTVTISGGNFHDLTTGYISQNNNSTLTVNNINYYNSSKFIEDNVGKVTINNGTIRTSNVAIDNETSGDITINNIDLIADYTNYAIYNKGKLKIISGTIESTKTTTGAVYNDGGSANLTLGVDDGTASKVLPSITGKTYGLVNNGGTFKFYDGIIEGSDKKSINLNGGSFIYASDYNVIKESVTKTINNTDTVREVAYLDLLDVAEVGDTGFKTLQSAIDYCQGDNTQTIEILRDITIGVNDNTVIVPQGKNIKIDLKGFKITTLKNIGFDNSGNLEIVDNPETSGEQTQTVVGEIINSVGVVFNNSGTLKLSKGNIKTTGLTYTVNDSSNTCYTVVNTGNTIVDGASLTGANGVINNSVGTFELKSGSLKSTSGNAVDSQSGTITITDGTINAYNIPLNIDNGTVNINGGTISGDANIFKNNTNVTMTLGTINASRAGDSNYYSIKLYDNSSFTMSGGTIDAGCLLEDSSSIRVSGGNIIKSYYNIYLSEPNTSATIEGGNLTASVCNLITSSEKTLNISGGTFNCTNYRCIENNSSKIVISGGTFTSHTQSSEYGTIYNKSELVITKATINGYNGIYSTGNGNKVTLGEKDNIINNEDIIINVSNRGIISEGTNKVFNYYDGKITAQEPIYGEVNDVPDGYRISKTANGNVYDCTLTEYTKIAEIEGKTTYYTLQEAVTASSNGDVIKVIKSYGTIGKEKCVIPQDKDITIDLNGFVIYNYGNFIQNKGTLKLIDSSNPKTGGIKGYSNLFIDNTGSLELNANIEQSQSNIVIKNSGTGTLKVVDGAITVNDNNTYSNNIIKTSSTGKVEICGGTFNVNPINRIGNYGYFINNSGIGDIDMYGGQVVLNANSYAVCYGIYSLNTNDAEVAKITISGGSISGEYFSYTVYANQYTDLEITDGTFTTTSGLDINGGTATIDGETVSFNTPRESINNDDGTVYIKKGNITSTIDSGGDNAAIINYGILNISGGNITNNVWEGIHNDSSAQINITGGTIQSKKYGIYNKGSVIMTDGVINNTDDYGVYLYNGSFTMGVNNLNVSTTKPSITSGSYGVYKNSAGSTFKFYDGVITGSTMAIYGEVNDMPEGFHVQTNEENTTAILDLDSQFNQVAFMDDGYYLTIQDAIDDALNKPNTIEIQTDVVITNSLIIDEGQNITIDLQGHKIYLTEGEYVIQNSGILTIIDSTSDSSIIQNMETGTTQGGDRIGVGIYNATTGTLTIGENDGTVKYAPTIIGDKYGIENNGVLNFYDGVIKAITSPVGVTQIVIDIPVDYTVDIKDESGVKIMKLVEDNSGN